MPFRSEAQRRWMFATHPAMAKRWARETPEGAKLPEHVKRRKHRKEALRRLGGSR